MYLALRAPPWSLLPMETTPGTGAQAAPKVSLAAATATVMPVLMTLMLATFPVLPLIVPVSLQGRTSCWIINVARGIRLLKHQLKEGILGGVV